MNDKNRYEETGISDNTTGGEDTGYQQDCGL